MFMQYIEFGKKRTVLNRDKFCKPNSPLLRIDIPEIDRISFIGYMSPGIPDAIVVIVIGRLDPGQDLAMR
jgi:hypothetical protein